jgi:putative nucleotidyltransferase with HDIG domain
LSIRNRFVVAAIAVLLVVGLVAALVVRHRLNVAERQRAGEDLSAAVEAARETFDERADRLAVQASLLTDVLPLAETLAAGERGRVADLLERFSSRYGDLAFAVVVTPGGESVARAGRHAATPALGELGSRAARHGAIRGLTVVDGRLALYSARPVRDPESGIPLAGVVVGEEVQPAAAELLSRLTGTEVVLLANRAAVVSTLPLGTAPAAENLASELRGGGARVVEIGGRTYLARADALATDDPVFGATGGSSGLLLLRGLDTGGPATRLVLRDVAVAGIVGLSLAATLLWLGSRRLNRALDELAGAMSETASTGRLVPDSLKELDERWAGSEVEELRASFYDLMRTVEESLRDRERSYVEAIGAVVAAIDARDHETTGHSFRVAHYALALARSLEMEAEELRAIEWGALLHDVGKIAVPDAILRKTGRLTEDEWHVMRQHPSWGFEMLADVKFLEPALAIVYSHHERWDGGGYPRGLRTEEIPLVARIFGVVDTYDSITSDRPYRRARGHAEAITELCRVAGTQLDPDVVEAFIRLPEVEIRRLRERSERLDLKIRIPDALTELRIVGERGRA